MKTCDICQKESEHLEQLREIYQTPEIKEACGDCIAVINKHLGELQTVAAKIQCSWLKRFMVAMRDRLARAAGSAS